MQLNRWGFGNRRYGFNVTYAIRAIYNKVGRGWSSATDQDLYDQCMEVEWVQYDTYEEIKEQVDPDVQRSKVNKGSGLSPSPSWADRPDQSSSETPPRSVSDLSGFTSGRRPEPPESNQNQNDYRETPTLTTGLRAGRRWNGLFSTRFFSFPAVQMIRCISVKLCVKGPIQCMCSVRCRTDRMNVNALWFLFVLNVSSGGDLFLKRIQRTSKWRRKGCWETRRICLFPQVYAHTFCCPCFSFLGAKVLLLLRDEGVMCYSKCH